MGFRLIRGDLARLQAHTYVVPSSGGFSGGASKSVLDGLHSRGMIVNFEGTSAAYRELVVKNSSKVPVGDASELILPYTHPIRIRAICANSAGDEVSLRSSLHRALRLAADVPIKSARIAIAAFGTGAHGTGADASARWMRDVLEKHTALIERHDVLVVLWSPGTHRAFHEAFGDLLNRDVGRIASDGVVSDFVDCLADPQSFLFVGSGLSRGASPPIPCWADLFREDWLKPISSFQTVDGVEKTHVRMDLLPDAAQVVQDENPGAIRQAFLDGVSIPAVPSPTTYQLLGLPWSCIITTNYDTLIEDALSALRLKPVVITTDEELASTRFDDAQVPVVKIHGGIGKKGRSPIVATRDEYDRFFTERPAMAAFLESRLLTAQGVIVGYSISDPHLRQLFSRIGGIKSRFADPGSRKTTARLFCVTATEPPLPAYWQRRGLEPLVVPIEGGDDSLFVQAVNAACVRAHDRLYAGLLNSNMLAGSGVGWETLATGLSPAQLGRLIVALVDAGLAPPPRKLLEKAANIEQFARRHLSPEQLAMLLASGSD